tara:strand:+ start:1062 stop:1733 length:672 start_codon:yes stop_codon:yes gene_type:complete
MATDSKNTTRLDLDDIYDSIKRRTFYKCKARNLDHDKYGISGEDTQVLYEFITEGAEIVANSANYIKFHTQSGYDALTYYSQYEKQDTDNDGEFKFESDTDEDGDLTNPDSVEIDNEDIMYQDDNSDNLGDRKTGEKLTASAGDTITFQITDLNTDQTRYTIVQGFIRSALINYSLYKWYSLVGLGEEASLELAEFNVAKDRVRYNAVGNHRNKKISRKYRTF